MPLVVPYRTGMAVLRRQTKYERSCTIRITRQTPASKRLSIQELVEVSSKRSVIIGRNRSYIVTIVQGRAMHQAGYNVARQQQTTWDTTSRGGYMKRGIARGARNHVMKVTRRVNA